MTINNMFTKSGFLLIEIVFALILISLISVYSAHYQWHTQMQNIRTNKQAQIIFSLYHFFEEKWYQQELSGKKEFKLHSLQWNSLPVKKENALSYTPVHVTSTYYIAGMPHTHTVITMDL